MNWEEFWQSIKAFFSNVGATFLASIKAAIPVAEQAAINFIAAIVTQIVTDIENGTIPLPALAAHGETVDPLALGKAKRDLAFNQVKAKLAALTVPPGMVITNSLIYWQIETSVQYVKQMGNQGNFPGGNSGPVAPG